MANVTDIKATPKTKERTTKRYFTDATGAKVPRAHTEATGFGIEFIGTEETLTAKLEDFSEGVKNAAALFGFVVSITNAAGGADKSDEDRVNAARDRLEALLEGDWSAERESGMRTNDIVEAARRINEAKGVVLNINAYRQKILSGEVDTKDLFLNRRFAATVAAIQAEKKQARAEAMAANISTEDDASLDALLSA